MKRSILLLTMGVSIACLADPVKPSYRIYRNAIKMNWSTFPLDSRPTVIDSKTILVGDREDVMVWEADPKARQFVEKFRTECHNMHLADFMWTPRNFFKWRDKYVFAGGTPTGGTPETVGKFGLPIFNWPTFYYEPGPQGDLIQKPSYYDQVPLPEYGFYLYPMGDHRFLMKVGEWISLLEEVEVDVEEPQGGSMLTLRPNPSRYQIKSYSLLPIDEKIIAAHFQNKVQLIEWDALKKEFQVVFELQIPTNMVWGSPMRADADHVFFYSEDRVSVVKIDLENRRATLVDQLDRKAMVRAAKINDHQFIIPNKDGLEFFKFEGGKLTPLTSVSVSGQGGMTAVSSSRWIATKNETSFCYLQWDAETFTPSQLTCTPTKDEWWEYSDLTFVNDSTVVSHEKYSADWPFASQSYDQYFSYFIEPN